MMDYSAEPSRFGSQGLPATPANSARVRAAIGGNGGGTTNSAGGPHILIFERDQQFLALLTSELQLAGYECHSARTAVEVFDAIARFSVKLVLVNLAQAAAGRREFWVALDAQRRGRGVQVLTFRCINLAGYGPAEPDEGNVVPAEVEVDGMAGLNALIDAVRSRISGPLTASTSGTGGVPRITNIIPSLQQPSSGTSNTPNAGTQPSRPMPAISPSSPNSISTQPQASNQSQATNQAQAGSNGGHQQASQFSEKIRAVIYPNNARSFAAGSDSGAGWSTMNAQNTGSMPTQSQQQTAPHHPQPPTNNSRGNTGSTPMLSALANGNSLEESGLDQLSRMLQEHNSNQQPRVPQRQQDEFSQLQEILKNQDDPMTITASHMRPSPIQDIPLDRANELRMERPDVAPRSTFAAHPNQPQAPAQPQQHIQQQPMANPGTRLTQAQDQQQQMAQSQSFQMDQTERMPTTHQVVEGRIAKPMHYTVPMQPPATPNPVTPVYQSQQSQQQSSPLNYALPAQQQRLPSSPHQTMPAQPQPAPRPSAPDHISSAQPQQRAQEQSQVELQSKVYPRSESVQAPASEAKTPTQRAPSHSNPSIPAVERPQSSPNLSGAADQPAPNLQERHQAEQRQFNTSFSSAANENVQAGEASEAERQRNLIDQIQTIVQGKAPQLNEAQEQMAKDTALLDIVQSLPPMPAPIPPQSPQAHVLNGRATRSLGSVLLEGHLVPQDRLEVAQGIQRMLRGVDLNYQLGEILLKFNLLTPDQLLAASLVSYGTITTQQISALGRVRQELHAIGLEYDLENLLILFRILSPDQLREVRNGW